MCLTYAKIKSNIEFFFTIFWDFWKYPFKIVKDFLSNDGDMKNKQRMPIQDSIVYVCVHEWGGYLPQREKTLKNGKTFSCGLSYQLERYKKYREEGKVHLCVTMSDMHLSQYVDEIKLHVDTFIDVDNVGMDFSGYAEFYRQRCNRKNSYVILSNSSVDSCINDFLDKYVEYMEKNQDVGLLGISYSTKMYQTLLRKNFTPHIQSFFLLTTTDVLREAVNLNHGVFPGEKCANKRLLIRKGEIGLSYLISELGYKLAIVYPETGIPFQFVDKKKWDKPFGDLRLCISFPNRITPIT